MPYKIILLCTLFISTIAWFENNAMQHKMIRKEYNAFCLSVGQNKKLYQDTLDMLKQTEDPHIKAVLIQDLIETYRLSKLDCTQQQIQYLIANYQD